MKDVQLACFSRPEANAFMIFPYRIDEKEKANLFTPKEMRKKYPECWKYLSSFKNILEKRSIQNGTPESWYRFGRSQSLAKFNNEPKIIWPVLSLEPRYAYDDNNVVITGGGNGPYYALRSQKDSKLSLFYILSILAHPAIEAFIRARSSKFRGGYGSHGKQFIINVPIPKIDFNDSASLISYEKIVKLAKTLSNYTETYKSEKTPGRKAILKRQIKTTRNRLMNAVEDLFDLTQEDIKTIHSFKSLNAEY